MAPSAPSAPSGRGAAPSADALGPSDGGSAPSDEDSAVGRARGRRTSARPSDEGGEPLVTPGRWMSGLRDVFMTGFAPAPLSEYAETRNDLCGCMGRILTDDAPVKTGRPGDGVGEQAGGSQRLEWGALDASQPIDSFRITAASGIVRRHPGVVSVQGLGRETRNRRVRPVGARAPRRSDGDSVMIHGSTSVSSQERSSLAAPGPRSIIDWGDCAA